MKCYNFYEKDDTAELDLFGEIGEDFWGDGNSFKNFQAELEFYKDKDLIINLDSVGGNVFDGNAIANAIKKRTKKTICNVYSICASIATQIALSCDEVNVFDNSIFMIHLASCGIYGNKNDLKKQVDILDKIDNILAETYCNKTGLDKETILNYMSEETWLNSKEAKGLGFVDNIIESNKMVAKANFDFNNYKDRFKNIPNNLLENSLEEYNRKAKEEADHENNIELENKIKNIDMNLELLNFELFRI